MLNWSVEKVGIAVEYPIIIKMTMVLSMLHLENGGTQYNRGVVVRACVGCCL